MKYWPSLSSWHHGFCHQLGGIHILCITEESGLLIQPPASTWPGGLQSILHSAPTAEINGTSNLGQLSICLPWPEQVFPDCSDKNIGRLQRGRNGGTEGDYDTSYRLQEICSGAKNKTEVLGFCTSTTRPFLFPSHLVSPMISLQQWLGKKKCCIVLISCSLVQAGDQIVLHKCSANLWKFNWGLRRLTATMIICLKKDTWKKMFSQIRTNYFLLYMKFHFLGFEANRY